MSTLFTRSLKQLQTEVGGRTVWPLLLITAVFALWLLWFLRAPITIFETSDSAELIAAHEAVAYFPPSALINLQPGQSAHLRLHDFPWATYGIVPASVTNVVPDLRNGRIQVTLHLNPDPQTAIPLQRNLTGTIEVEVGNTSPSTMLLQAVGYRVAQIGSQPTTPTESINP